MSNRGEEVERCFWQFGNDKIKLHASGWLLLNNTTATPFLAWVNLIECGVTKTRNFVYLEIYHLSV